MISTSMDDSAIAALEHPGHGEPIDADDFLETTTKNEVDMPEESHRYFPREYVELVMGPRGGGKSVRVARKLLKALKAGKAVFTNYELYPEKIGIDNQPRPLDLEFLLSFDTSLNEAVIGIGEVDTWIERKRAMSTSNIMVEKFLSQLRKRGLRVFMDTQSPTLPTVILNKVDLTAWGQDSYWSGYGQEHEVCKGTNFFYSCRDNSGLFTGKPGYSWNEALGNCQKLWPLYNTYQIFDPWQWAKKVEIVGSKMVFDMDDRRLYTGGERNLALEQKEIEQFNTLLKAEYRAWGNAFVDFAMGNNAVLENQPNKFVISIHELQKGIARLPKTKQKATEKLITSLNKLATDSNGYLARIDRGQNAIELAKPIPTGGETNEN